MNKFGSWSRISSQNEKESLRVYSLIANCLSIFTKNVSRLQLQVLNANKIVQKGGTGSLTVVPLWISESLYIMPGLLLLSFKYF